MVFCSSSLSWLTHGLPPKNSPMLKHPFVCICWWKGAAWGREQGRRSSCPSITGAGKAGGAGWCCCTGSWNQGSKGSGILLLLSLSRVRLFVTSWTAAWGLPYPSPSPGACSNSCPLSQWWHPTVSSSVTPFSSCLQSFPESGSFPVRRFFTSDGQSILASASASVLPTFRTDFL